MDRKLQVHGSRLLAAVTLAAAGLGVSTWLGCSEEGGAKPPTIIAYDGFLGSYYPDLTIEEAADSEVVPELMRMDAFIDFPAARATFGTESESGRYTARWQGYVFVPEEGVRGLVITGLGRAGILVDGRVVVRPQADGGLIDERIQIKLDTGWRQIDLWYQNLDRNTHAIRFGWMSPNSDLVPIAGGFIGVGDTQIPEGPLNLTCEAENVGFQNATVRVRADSVATINVKAGLNDLTSEVAISQLRAELIRLEPESTVTVTVTATGLRGAVENATCVFETPALPHWVPGHWRAEYYDSTDLTEVAGTRFEPATLAYPADLPFASGRTEWFPGVGTNTFSVRLSAWMLVEDQATYRFTMGSDDGVRALVDGDEIVDLWRDGGFEGDEGDVLLRPGYHEVAIEYYQGFGASRLEWEIARLDAAGQASVISPDILFGEILEEPEEAARISAGVQGDLNFDDESASQWVEAGCTQGLDLLLNQPAALEVQGELLQLSLDAPATTHALCVLEGIETRADVRLTDLDGAQTDWMRVDFTRPEPEEPEPGL